jgi:hypothetical protein
MISASHGKGWADLLFVWQRIGPHVGPSRTAAAGAIRSETDLILGYAENSARRRDPTWRV